MRNADDLAFVAAACWRAPRRSAGPDRRTRTFISSSTVRLSALSRSRADRCSACPRARAMFGSHRTPSSRAKSAARCATTWRVASGSRLHQPRRNARDRVERCSACARPSSGRSPRRRALALDQGRLALSPEFFAGMSGEIALRVLHNDLATAPGYRPRARRVGPLSGWCTPRAETKKGATRS